MKTNKKVIIYSTQTCPYCVYAKQFFSQHGIQYEDVDVSRDRTRAIEMVQKSGQMGVPVVDIEGTIILGFNPDAFTQALG